MSNFITTVGICMSSTCQVSRYCLKVLKTILVIKLFKKFDNYKQEFGCKYDI